jgi:hypothetical protein
MSRPGSIPLSWRPRLYGLYAIDSVYGELVPCSPRWFSAFGFFRGRCVLPSWLYSPANSDAIAYGRN